MLDDYAGAALDLADWSRIAELSDITVFRAPLGDDDAKIRALASFDILCTMRERTALSAEVLNALTRLRLLCIIGARVSGIDLGACLRRGVMVCRTETVGPGHSGTPELTWALILNLLRGLPEAALEMRQGGWQRALGTVAEGKVLGLLGLGRVGGRVARIGAAFGMDVIAWSPNLTSDRAAMVGARAVSKPDLFREADVISLHLVLSESSRGIVDRDALGRMKRTAYLINTARGPLVEEAALYSALREGRIAGAGLDVFHREPLPNNDPLRQMPNVLLTPHLGYSVRERMADYYHDTAENVAAFLDGAPVRTLALGDL